MGDSSLSHLSKCESRPEPGGKVNLVTQTSLSKLSNSSGRVKKLLCDGSFRQQVQKRCQPFLVMAPTAYRALIDRLPHLGHARCTYNAPGLVEPQAGRVPLQPTPGD